MSKVKSIFRHWIPLAAVATALCLFVYLAVQQSMRWGANDPQIQMAEDAAAALASGGTPESMLPAARVDISTSLASFMVIYDNTGKPLASSALLNGEMPVLPAGVFDYVRQKGEDRVSWQPQPGVRMAIVVVPISGGQAGFVMAGRSLREVEKRVDQLGQITLIAWLATLAGSLVVVALSETIFFDRKQNP